MGNSLNPNGFPPPGGKKGGDKKREPFKKREAPPQRVGRKKKKKGVDTASKLPSGLGFYNFSKKLRNLIFLLK